MQMKHPLHDIVVVLPGIMGSTLARNGELVWAPSAGAALRAIADFSRYLEVMSLPKDIGDENPNDGVEPVGLMPDLHILPGLWTANIGYGVLWDWLLSRFDLFESSLSDPNRIPNLLAVPYDWRLSNRYNGRRLKGIVEPALERWRAKGGHNADAKLIFICHSMGGLVARWYIENEGGHEFTRKLVTLGTPYRGAIDALDQLVNGVKKDIGPIKFELTTFARSLPSVYQLLPEYACIETPVGLLKTTETNLPVLLEDIMVKDAMRFHEELDSKRSSPKVNSYDIHLIIGIRQTTYTTARISGDRIEPIVTIAGENETGDGTVPRLAAIPKAISPSSPIIHSVADKHGSLQSNRAVLDELDGILTASPIIHRAADDIELGVHIDSLFLSSEPVSIEATVDEDQRVALLAKVIDERGQKIAEMPLQRSGAKQWAIFDPLPPGAYRVSVGGINANAGIVSPVTSTILVW